MNFHQASRDLLGVVGLAIISLAAGLTLNRAGANPLPLAYRSPQQRLQAQLAQLVAAPALESFPVETISMESVRAAIQNRSATILDARSAPYYESGHLPGALELSRDQFGRDYLRLRARLEKAKNHPIVVYCSGGACHDSKMVAQALSTLGFSNVRIFAGGWDDWTAAGLPVERR